MAKKSKNLARRKKNSNVLPVGPGERSGGERDLLSPCHSPEKLERTCRNTRQEIQVLRERQEIFQSMMEDKLKFQSRANERYHDQIFEEIKELEQKKSEETLPEEARFMDISK